MPAKMMISVELSAREIALLANAINEAREAVDEWEFHTRLGATPAEADELGRKLRRILGATRESE